MMKRLVNLKVWIGVLMLVPASAAAQVPPAAPPQDRYVVGQAKPPVTPGAPLVDLTLEAAIGRALEKNLDIQSIRITPQIQDYAVRLAHAVFRPTVSGSYGYSNSSSQSTSQLDGGARITNQTNTFNSSINQLLPWQGGRITGSFNNSRTATDNSFSTRNPNYSSNLSLNYTQPLLAGRKIDSQRNALRTSQIQRQITDISVQSQIENVSNRVRVAYWGLRSAIEQIEIQQRALDQAIRTQADNKIKVEVGNMAEIELAQNEAQVATAEQGVLNARIGWMTAELALKQLLVSGADDELFKSTINPLDQPTFELQNVDIPAAIARALTNRTDIETTRRTLQIAKMNLEISKDNTKPDLGLSANYRLAGVGGDLYNRSGLGGTAVLVEPGGYFDALRALSGFETPTWSFTFNYSQPIGINADKATYARAQLELQRSEITMKSQELTIATEVTSAGLAVQNAYLQLLASRKTREAAEKNAEAEQTRFSAGVSTNFQVVQLQNALTTARNSELSSIIRYVNAVAEFDRVQRVGR